MLHRPTIFGFVLSICACTAVATEQDVRFTPPGMGYGSNELYERWLARPLLLLGEPSLWAKFSDNSKIQTYRITKAPSFTIGAVARLEILPDGSAKLHAIEPDRDKIEQMARGGVERDLLLVELRKKAISRIDAASVSNLEFLFDESGFWTDTIDPTERRTAKSEPLIMDGTTYFIEASFAGRYKMITRHGCRMESGLKSIVQNIADLASAKSLADGCELKAD